MYIHKEQHKIGRIGWLRAAVLGANDGLISTTSLIIGVAAAQSSYTNILIAGFAGLIAGAVSMAAGEYISVSSQADTEKADLQREKIELETNIKSEREELTDIYVDRGLEHSLAKQVAQQLMAKDALGAHARDELGITETLTAKPFQAAFTSASSFTIGALFPLIIVFLTPIRYLIPVAGIITVFLLAILGAIAAKAGGAPVATGAMRVTVWGTFAMVLSASIGSLLGVVI